MGGRGTALWPACSGGWNEKDSHAHKKVSPDAPCRGGGICQSPLFYRQLTKGNNCEGCPELADARERAYKKA